MALYRHQTTTERSLTEYSLDTRVPSFSKGEPGRISQHVPQCTNLLWFDLVLRHSRRDR
jgi:hypothetical protein